MQDLERNSLWDLVDYADVAIRIASQLRQLGTDHPLSDRECLIRGVQFLQQATLGGQFLSGQQVGQFRFDSGLQPLNWATDTYLRKGEESGTPEVDYADLSRYLQRLSSSLQSILDSGGPGPGSDPSTEGISFFETLGGILGTRADHIIQRQQAPPLAASPLSA